MKCMNKECDCYNDELSNRCDVNGHSEMTDCKDLIIEKEKNSEELRGDKPRQEKIK